MIAEIWRILQPIEDYLDGGGIVLIPILLISFIMWILIINRLIYFRKLYRKNMDREDAGDHIRNGLIPDSKKYSGATSVFITKFLKRKTGDPDLDKYILDELVIQSVSSLNQYLSIITLLASAAPLLGLLGTVTGMITTFNIISVFGTGNAKAMAGGISEALITTQSGLLVSIPGLYLSGFLRRRAETLKHRISSLGIYLYRYV